ncbi:hypothetical protein KP509_23G057900 [Ceratopteris richardii]|uniref:BTB domain-containing protein n=1 Tax=Ceratopteris richardii TaxID=49495 RepID=A0A8T2S046_CERRI|nr:hypothetical protein KP509_23G057900 [Ceratopteris richardii]
MAMSSVMEQETRVHVVDGDLDYLYYADEPEEPPLPRKKVPTGDIYEAARAGDVERLKVLLERGANVNVRDAWDSVALYYACLAGHLDAARMLMERGAICSENTFDGDRCHYAALNLRVRKLLKVFEARPPPLDPLPRSLRELFLSSKSNLRYVEGLQSALHEDNIFLDQSLPSKSFLGDSFSNEFNPDFVMFVHGQPIEAHRAILIARSSYFKSKFEKDWKYKKEVRLSNAKLTFPALFSLIQFFYTDRLDVAVEDMEDLARICKVCGCTGLQTAVEKELLHQKYAEYKHLRNVDDSQRRFILQGSSLPEEERLPCAMRKLLNLSLMKSKGERALSNKSCTMQSSAKINCSTVANNTKISESPEGMLLRSTLCNSAQCSKDNNTSDMVMQDDHADVAFVVEDTMFRSHQVILAARSDYFWARFCRMKGFKENDVELVQTDDVALPVLQENDLNTGTFEHLLEYMYTDQLSRLDPNQLPDTCCSH